MDTAATIEAILFWKAEPISTKQLATILHLAESEIITAVQTLRERLNGRGVQILEKDGEVMLGTHPAASQVIEQLTKEELNRDLGKAGLETLTIVLYKGPITRAELDYIRGVNSSFICVILPYAVWSIKLLIPPIAGAFYINRRLRYCSTWALLKRRAARL